MANKNRDKGHRFERILAQLFRDMGFSYCKTSRQASRMLDDSKVDLAFIPYNVQAKAVKATINYQTLFESMDEELIKNFPPTDPQRTYPKMIFHRRGRLKTQKFVIMLEDEFVEILKQVNKKDESTGEDK
jgi:hypothetical protein